MSHRSLPMSLALSAAAGLLLGLSLPGTAVATGAGSRDAPTAAFTEGAAPTAEGPTDAEPVADDQPRGDQHLDDRPPGGPPEPDTTDTTPPAPDDDPADDAQEADGPRDGLHDLPDPRIPPTGPPHTIITTPFLPTDPPTGGQRGSERVRAWERLQEAENDLVRLRAEVQRTAREVSALDERLADAAGELADISEVLASAEARLEDARATERDAAARLQRAQADLSAAVDGFDDSRSRLNDRTVAAFKYGASPTADLFVRSVAGASSWHEVAVAMETVSRLLADDRQLVTAAVDRTRDTAALEAEVARTRSEAVTAAQEAIVEQARVETILSVQASLVAEIELEREDRAAALAALEASAAAREVLISDLEARVIELGFTGGHWFIPIEVNLDIHGPAPSWASRLPPAGRQWAAAIDAVASRHGIDGRLMAALVWSESNFNPGVVSSAGALGLAQLMPGTARGLGVDPRDPIANLDGGTRYLRAQLERFGRLDLALAAYNAGPNRVAAVGRVPNIVETQLYVVRVMDRYQMLMGG